MSDRLQVLASELPILTRKGNYKYLGEIAGNGQYKQVAWQKTSSKYLPLYGIQELKTVVNDTTEIEFPDDWEG